MTRCMLLQVGPHSGLFSLLDPQSVTVRKVRRKHISNMSACMFACTTPCRMEIQWTSCMQYLWTCLPAQRLCRMDIMYAIEESGFCVRLWLNGNRPFDIMVSAGAQPGGASKTYMHIYIYIYTCKYCPWRHVLGLILRLNLSSADMDCPCSRG